MLTACDSKLPGVTPAMPLIGSEPCDSDSDIDSSSPEDIEDGDRAKFVSVNIVEREVELLDPVILSHSTEISLEM
jgi:hypothetical protein